MRKTYVYSISVPVFTKILCVFLCFFLVFYYTCIFTFAEHRVNTDAGNLHPKVSGGVFQPDKSLKTKNLAGSYAYYGATTKVLISTNGGSSFTDDTANLLANGYVGKVGENTIIRLQLTGYKYAENAFTYTVTQKGGLTWSSFGTWTLYQDKSGSTGTNSPTMGLSFLDSSSKTYYSYFYIGATSTTVSQTAASIYQYTRSLNYYTSPQFSVLKNGSAVSGAGSSGNTSVYSTLSKSHNASYNSMGASHYNFPAIYVYGFWSTIATSYAALANTSRNQSVKDKMNEANVSSLISGTTQWDTADSSAYSGLDYTQFSPTSAQQYTAYYDINLSSVTNPATACGQYSISLDSGAVTSQTFTLSLYEFTDSSLTMQEAQTSGTIASDTAQMKVYNGNSQTMGVSSAAASAVLGSHSLTLANTGYFTASNVSTFGSSTAMSNAELYIENKNLKSAQTLSSVSSGGFTTYDILLKNANAISQALSGSVTFNMTFTCGSATVTKSVSVNLNSVVPQITVSVPLDITLYTAKDGSVKIPHNNLYYIGNYSYFPVSVRVSATLVENSTTGKDSNNNDYFPPINASSSFKLWIKSTQSGNIQFSTVSGGITATDYNDFGIIAANGGVLNFSLSNDGALPAVATPGTYHYKIYFKFYHASGDYS